MKQDQIILSQMSAICDTWKEAQTGKAFDVLGGGLPALADCIRHHPGLRTECAALDALTPGSNELTRLMNATESGVWDGRKLNGPELWFAKKARLAHEGAFSDFMALLDDAIIIFKNDPQMARVAAAMEKILGCRDVIEKVRRFMDSL